MVYLNLYLPKMNFPSPLFFRPLVLLFTTPRQKDKALNRTARLKVSYTFKEH